MTAAITKREFDGAVLDVDMGWSHYSQMLLEAREWGLGVGISGLSGNAYGERIATYGYVQSGARSRHAQWVKRAKTAVVQYYDQWAESVFNRILLEQADGPQMLEGMAMRMEDVFRSSVLREKLVDTGALLHAVSHYSPLTKLRVVTGGWKQRAKREFGQMSARQQLYQLYHKGRSRSSRRMRLEWSFGEFRQRFGAQWMFGYRKEHADVRRAVAAVKRRAAQYDTSKVYASGRAERAAMWKRVHRSQAAHLIGLLGGEAPQQWTKSTRRRAGRGGRR